MCNTNEEYKTPEKQIEELLNEKIASIEDAQTESYTITLDQIGSLEEASGSLDNCLDELQSWKSKFQDFTYDMDNADSAVSEISDYN